MLVIEGTIESKDGLGAGIGDSCNNSLLSVSTIVVSRGNDDRLTNLPVERDSTDVAKGDSISTGGCSHVKISPDVRSGLAVHLELSIADTDNLVTISGKVRIGLNTVHGDGQFRVVRELFCSNFDVSTVDHDVASIESSLLGLINIVGWENERAVYEDE